MKKGQRPSIDPDDIEIAKARAAGKKDNGDMPPEIKELPLGGVDYRAMYEKARQTGKLNRRTSRIFSWGIDGDELIGKIVDIKDFDGGKFEQKCNQYLMETNQGNRNSRMRDMLPELVI